MKKIVLACSWIVVMAVSACSDWLDVSPKTDVKSEDFFTSEDGFKSALIGIYGRMTNTSLYGGHMTFNFMEKLVQRYDNNTDSKEVRAKIYDYKNIIKKANLNHLNNSTNSIYHVVVEGDTLSLLAKKYNVNWEKIYELNKDIIGDDPNQIYPGQNLLIKEE